MNGDVNNDDRYSDYPLKLRAVSGLPPIYISRDILPLLDVPHKSDPRRKRSLQQILDLERDRANRPLILLDNKDEDQPGPRLLTDEEYKRRLRRVVVSRRRANPVLRPLHLPNVRDPRRVQACKRAGHPDWALGPPTVVENDFLPAEEETCPVLVVDLTDWPHSARCEVEIWPHECNHERARLDAQLLYGEGDSLMDADNADRDDVVECDENGAAVRHFHADVDTPMLGDADDEVLVDAVFEQETGPSCPRERRLSGGEMVVRVKDERLLRRPMPADDDEPVDLVDLCSDGELDAMPKREPKPEPEYNAGYREDVVREVLEVVTLDDDDDDDDEDVEMITSDAAPPCVLDVSSETESNGQSDISISQRHCETDDRNATPAARVQQDTGEYYRENHFENVIQEDTEPTDTRSPSPSNSDEEESDRLYSWRAAPAASACGELVPAYVCDYEHRSMNEPSACNRPHRNCHDTQSDATEMQGNADEARAVCAITDLPEAWPMALPLAVSISSVLNNEKSGDVEPSPPSSTPSIPRDSSIERTGEFATTTVLNASTLQSISCVTDVERTNDAFATALNASQLQSMSCVTDAERTDTFATALIASQLQSLELRFDGAIAAFREQWREPSYYSSPAVVWPDCEKLGKERRTTELSRRWRPYVGGRMGAPPVRQQLEQERAFALLQDFFALAASWSSISIIIGTHNLSLRCLLQAHANAKRSVEFWRARNDHWKDNDYLPSKDVAQIENYDSSDNNNDQRSLCFSYDGDEEEINDCEDLILQEDQFRESSFSDSSLLADKIESISKNFNSDASSSLQINFEQDLFVSKVGKSSDSKFRRDKIKSLKKRHSLPAVVTQQAKRSRSYSDEVRHGETSSSLKLTIKRDRKSQEYRVSSQNVQLRESENFLKIIDDDISSDDFTSNNTTDRPLLSENRSLVEKTLIHSKLKVHIDETVPELELNDTRPVNMPVNRNNLENSLSSFLKSKLKRSCGDVAEVGRKRQKVADDCVAVNINLNITVNSLLEDSLQKEQPLEIMSSNDNVKELLPKTRTIICSTSDFSSCNNSDDESTISPKLNSNNSMPKNSYLKKLVHHGNPEPVKSTQEILQVDHNCNIEKEVPQINKISLGNSENETKKTKSPKILFSHSNLRLVFNNLFGETSDASETEEKILKKKRRKSREMKRNLSATNDAAESVEKNQSNNKTVVPCTVKQDKSKLKDLNICSLKSAVTERIEEVSCSETEICNVELIVTNKSANISVEDNNVQIVNLTENQIGQSNIQSDKQNDVNKSSSNANLQKQIEEHKRSCVSEESNSYIPDKNVSKQIIEHEKSCDSVEITSYIAEKNIPKPVDEFEKNNVNEETNSHIIDDFSSKDQVMPDGSQAYDQVDMEGGDFEFISSISKTKTDNEYSDDEYNNYSDFDVEYHEPRKIEYNSDIELIENHKNPSNNKDLHNTINEKSDFTNNLHKQEESSKNKTHNLNKLPSFYNEDVKNFVNEDIEFDDEDILILNDFGPVSKIQNEKSKFNADKDVKSETVINLDSDEEAIEVIEEIIFETINDDQTNKVINDTKESVTNSIISNTNIEGASETCQLTNSNVNTLEIKNTVEKIELDEKNLSVLECDLGKSLDKESTTTNIYKNTLDSTKETVTSINTFVNTLIEDTLEPSAGPIEKSAAPNESVIDFSENILDSNTQTVLNGTLITDVSEDILDVNRKSVSPNALIIDETAGNNDSNISKNFTENNLNSCNIGGSINNVTSSANAIQYSGNINNDLNNPNVLQKFNLAREIVAPEEVKDEPVMSEDHNIEQQICENLLEEFKRNSCNSQDQTSVSIVVKETDNVLVNQSDSGSIPSSILIEVTVENPEELADKCSDWMDIDDLNKKTLNTTGPFKCRDINELLEKPVNKKIETTKVTEASNLQVPITVPLEIPSSTTNTDSTINMVHTQNNDSTSQINQQNNLIIGNNLIQANVPEPIYLLSNPVNQIQNMENQFPLQVGIPQQIHQPILNTVNATVIPQYAPQLYIISSVENNQNLSQGNSQIFTSVIPNNVQNHNSSQANPQTPVTSKNIVYASSMFTNMFAQKNVPSNLPEQQNSKSNANIPTVVPNNPFTIFSLPISPLREIILPKPLSITPQENQSTAIDKVLTFRRIILIKIETELNQLRMIPPINIETYSKALIFQKSLTEDVWNYQLIILNIMKCLHAIHATTTEKDYKTIMVAISNSLKPSEIPQMGKSIDILKKVFEINQSLGNCGYQLRDNNKYMNPVRLELQDFYDQNQLRQRSNSMSKKQKQQLESQVQDYGKLFKKHQALVNSLKPKYNLKNQRINQNNAITIRPVNMATISNNSTDHNNVKIKSINQNNFVTIRPVNIETVSKNSTDHNSLQKSSLNDTNKKQTINKSQMNNNEICISSVDSRKKEANSESILDNLNPICLKCKKASEIVCSNCLSVGYCSRECQYNHWKEVHYKTCKDHHNRIEAP